jgi:hypothetical protein
MKFVKFVPVDVRAVEPPPPTVNAASAITATVSVVVPVLDCACEAGAIDEMTIASRAVKKNLFIYPSSANVFTSN